MPADRHGVRGGLMALAALAVAHFAVPGHPQLATHGIPLGPAGTVIVSGVLTIAMLHRTARVRRTAFAACGGAMIALLAARIVVGAGIPQNGWSARYFANEAWAGAPEWSSDFRFDETTRIDQQIWFQDDEFPAHYLNGVSFDRGIRREVTEPMSVEWRGYMVVDDAYRTRVAVKARGTATVLLDNGAVLTASSLNGRPEAETSLALEPGLHVVTVRYMKPRDTDGLMQLDHSLTVTAAPPPLERAGGRAVRLMAARAIDAVLLFVFAFAAIQTIWRHWQPSMLVPAALIVGFGWQGWWRARPLADRVVSLTSGDDWFGFESSARDILHHGPLMTLGKPVGEGAAYFFHPLYCYFLAAIHAVTGESLFGPVFVQFLILAAVAILLWRLAAALFGARPALIGLVALVTIFELDFARYYTITLLSENLYILTVTLTLVPFVRWIGRGDRRDLWRVGLWGGVSSMTRPSMMLFFIPALALVAFIASTRARSWRASVVPVATVALLWLAAIAPVTIRNAIVARRFVLISDGLGAGFIKYNIPASADPAVYASRYSGSVLSGLGVLARIAWDHPIELLKTQARKLGFSLGMVHWFGGYRPHPELVGVTLLYIATVIASTTMRARVLWPVHLFVLAHLASMGLTMPWNYGYRLIIPPFVYTSTLSAAAASSLIAMGARGHARRPESRV